MGYKLSKKAESDFKGIYKYTYKVHGEQQADKYTESLEKCFDLLSENTTMGRNIDHIKKDILRHEHKEHIIFYKIKNWDILVVRILHKNMDVPEHIKR